MPRSVGFAQQRKQSWVALSRGGGDGGEWFTTVARRLGGRHGDLERRNGAGFYVKGEHTSFCFQLVTCLLLSGIVTLR